MSDLTGASSAGFPQSAGCRTMGEMALEMSESTGGGGRDKRLRRASGCIRRSIRQYNRFDWKFNRQTEDIALGSPVSGTNNKYALDTSFRTPYMAMLVDSDGKDRRLVDWVPYRPFNRIYESKLSEAGVPSNYTARSVFREGVVFVGPQLDTSNLTYPTMRLEFHSRIDHPSDNSCIETPEEVEEGIFSLALYLYLMKERSESSLTAYKRQADELFLMLEQEHRDWPDHGSLGENE